jgi:adenylate cyclase
LGIEIERKFLLTGEGWRREIEKSVRMAQGYVNDIATVNSGQQKASVRVRVAGDEAFLNIKSRELGHTRQEFDYRIPVADAEALMRLCVGGLIEKTRHHVHHDGFLWEIDIFEGDNLGLRVAEIELPAADAEFAKPDWIGREVTDQLRYYNLALADYPYCRWTAEEKA